MTPSALTPAARGSTKKKPRTDSPSRPGSARSAGHRSNVRRSVAPAAPRRVSGPTGGAASAGVIAVPAPAPARTRPARPTTRTAPSRPRTRSAAKAPWRLRSAAYLRALPDHVLLDRIIRGRVWIPLLGVLLAGIVAMQVEVLKLNAGIGRSLQRGSALQAQNELLRAGVAQLSDEQRIERIAAQMGMIMPAPEQLRFVRGGAGSVQRALGGIHAPDATSFIAHLPVIGAPAAAQGTSVNAGVGLAPTTSSSTSAPVATTSSTDTTASAGTSSGTAASATATGTPTASTPTASTPTASTPTASTPTPAGTTPAGTTPAGTTDQSSASSTGGAGVTPVGG